MQTLIVIVLVALAAFYVASRFWKARKGAPCCSDCAGCPCKGDPKARAGMGLAPFDPSNACPDGRTVKEGCPARDRAPATEADGPDQDGTRN